MALYTYSYGMHQVVPACIYLFWEKCHPSKVFPQKKPQQEPQNKLLFSPPPNPTSLNPLTEGPSPMYWLGTSRWYPGPCACVTTICVCLLSLPHHSCHSCVVLFCYVYWVVFVSCGVRGVWAFGLTLHSFVPPWTGYYLGKDICLYSPLGFHFCHSSSCPSHGPCACATTICVCLLSLPHHSCHSYVVLFCYAY